MTQPHYIDREAVARIKRFVDGEMCALIYASRPIPEGGFMEDLRVMVEALSAPMEAVAWRQAVEHLRECVNLVPAPGAIEAAERFLAVIPIQGLGSSADADTHRVAEADVVGNCPGCGVAPLLLHKHDCKAMLSHTEPEHPPKEEDQ